jgi:NADPH2:quinone reductase
MLAIEVSAHGGPEALEPVERPDPRPGPGQVLVRNRWIGVNYVDLSHRRGTPYPVRLPLIPGTEATGHVAAVGSGVDTALIGRPVAHFGHIDGVYAQLTAVDRRFVVPLDDERDLEAVAAIAIAGTTAHVLARVAWPVSAGMTVAVHSAAGATGGAVVQMAATAGADVIAIASTPAKAKSALELGARHALAVAETPDLAAAVRELTGGRGVDVVYDAAGRDTFTSSLDMTATRGVLVCYGQSSGPPPLLDVSRLSGLTASGSGSGSLTVSFVSASHYLDTAADRSSALRAVLSDMRTGRLTPRITRRFPLRQAADAHRLLESRAVVGKLLLEA